MPPQYSDRFTQNFARLKKGNWLRDNEYEMRRKDGSAFPVLISATAVKDADGRFIRSRASVFDISKRRAAENELDESETRNAAILRAALDCVVSIDSHGKIIELTGWLCPAAAEWCAAHSRFPEVYPHERITLHRNGDPDDAPRR